VSLQGQLRDFGVADVFQLIAQQRKTGVLEVEAAGRVFQVYFDAGRVVRGRPHEKRSYAAFAEYLVRTGAVSESALTESLRMQEETFEPLTNLLLEAGEVSPEELESVGRLITDEVIFELFRLDDGRFCFRAQSTEAEPGDQAIGAEQVLLDALRMRDEWEQVCRRIPDFEQVPTPTLDIEEFRQRRDELAASSGVSVDGLERLFRLSNGRLSARRVIDLSRLGTFGGGRGLVWLQEQGLLQLETPRPRSRELVEAEPRGGRPWLHLVALGIGALSALLLLTAPRGVSDRPIPADGLEAARRAVDTEQIQLNLEARRWLDGGYPEVLAAPSAARYLYRRSGRGYALYPDLP
jgi:hypothetical protein